LNILIKDDEFEDAVKLALEVYNLGADAIIIQDLGLMQYLLKNYPEIPVHSSTQMTTHNLEGVKQLENMGVSRVVLSRELSINEIKNICANSNVEIETFIHGALCICYSGQCLFSSIIGGRSGNRGLCAQPCRLPYTLIDEQNNVYDKGYLISPKDLNAIEYLPELIKCGVKCFKIEGRLKSPEYVGIITKFYRKYIDIVCDNQNLQNEKIIEIIMKEMSKINEDTLMTDKEQVTQVFNRGGFSEGHLSDKPNKNLIFKDKPSNQGFYLGKIEKFNENKGYITLNAKTKVNIGDKIGINSDIYTISELMIKNKNVKDININDSITIGRVKGDIKPGQLVYKLQSKILNDSIIPTFKENKEYKKINLNCKVYIHKNKPITFEVNCDDKNSIYFGEKIIVNSDILPMEAINSPISKEKIISNISKTGNTPYEFKNINIDLEDNLFVQIGSINEIRRNALEKLENRIINKYITSRNLEFNELQDRHSICFENEDISINILLNILNKNYDYTKLKNINKLYIPLKYFILSNFQEKLTDICNKFNVYIYMPNVLRDNINIDFDNIITKFNITGFIISSINQIDILKKYKKELVGNFNLNVYNYYTAEELKKIGISTICITPELNDIDTKKLINNLMIPSELMVYGRIPFMTMNYCVLGNSNKCYKECKHLCNSENKYYLKDRMNFNFRIVPDNISTITTIYNSKITSFEYNDYNVNNVRISILDESLEEIQKIIDTVKEKKRFEGKEYCGHFNKIENT